MTSQQASAGAMALPPAKPISQIDAEAEAAFNTSTLIRWLDYNDTWLAAEWGHPSDNIGALLAVAEEPAYSKGYLNPAERSIANAVQVHFRDGTHTDRVEVVYPIGHPRRRAAALPRLRLKLQANLATAFEGERVERIVAWFDDGAALADMTVSDFMDALVAAG